MRDNIVANDSSLGNMRADAATQLPAIEYRNRL